MKNEIRLPHLVIAVLTRAGAEPGALRRIVERILETRPEDRGEALVGSNILTGLRGLSGVLKREVKEMPITVDLMKNEIIGPALRQGLRQGRVEGQIGLLTSQIERRSGPVAAQLRKRLASLDPDELTAVGIRLLDAQSTDDLLARPGAV